jgi:hypothetical protein
MYGNIIANTRVAKIENPRIYEYSNILEKISLPSLLNFIKTKRDDETKMRIRTSKNKVMKPKSGTPYMIREMTNIDIMKIA